MTTGALFVEEPIVEFKGQWRFLSNFWVQAPFAIDLGPVLPDGPGLPQWGVAQWPRPLEVTCVEQAFQVAKIAVPTAAQVERYGTVESMVKAVIGEPHEGRWTQPGAAKAAGKRALLRPDWEQVKVQVMLHCLRAKFPDTDDDEGLSRQLIVTSPRVLIEGNTWGDRYWGVSGGSGKNMLGRLLMLRRAELTTARAAGLPTWELRPHVR